MKREKKKKLNKKDRFKEVKKAPVPMHSAPLFIKNIYGIETITDSGIFQVGENIFSKLYRISISDPSVKAHDVFQVFRGYDFKFRIYYINEEIYLNVLFTSEKDNAWGTCDDLYKNMCSNLAEYSVMLEDIKANERFKLVHSIILDNADLPFNISYFDNTTVLDWKDTFELSGLEESVDIFKKKDSEYKIFYVREFSPKITDFIREIFDMREVKQIVTQFDPVSDMAVQAFFKKNYMGTENLLEDMIRNNPHVYDMGFTGGNILEPACGIGNFYSAMPTELRDNSRLYGIELDTVSQKIAHLLHPTANIENSAYEKSKVVGAMDNFYDVAIGNVPFGDFKIHDKKYKNKLYVHDYFFEKTLDKIVPGGLMCFITSTGTFDKANEDVRKYIAERAELVGAIRLPVDTFSSSANTQTTTDIIFLKKRDSLTLCDPDWVHTGEYADGMIINNYYINNPDMMLGELKKDVSRYGEDRPIVYLAPDKSTSLSD